MQGFGMVSVTTNKKGTYHISKYMKWLFYFKTQNILINCKSSKFLTPVHDFWCYGDFSAASAF
jgi:hypothetical protein